MTLKEWIKSRRDKGVLVRIVDIANDLGVARTTLSRAINGGDIRLSLVAAINRMTGGKVRPSDWAAWREDFQPDHAPNDDDDIDSDPGHEPARRCDGYGYGAGYGDGFGSGEGTGIME